MSDAFVAWLRSGEWFTPGVPGEDALSAALLAGLQRRAHAVLADGLPAMYLVAEARTTRPARAAGLDLEGGFQSHGAIASTELVRFGDLDGGAKTAPLAHTTRLIPTQRNLVEVRLEQAREPRVVRLVVLLAGPLGPTDGRAGGPPDEIDLYCNAAGAETLEAFRTLLAAQWPADIASPPGSRGIWPLPGVRPVHPRRAGWSATPGVATLLEHVVHPLAERFARLPLAPLGKFEEAAGGSMRIEIPVRVGSSAPWVAQRLHDRVMVNHVLFWNRLVGVADRWEMRERDGAGEGSVARFPLEAMGVRLEGRPIVLSFEDRFTGLTFEDEVWAYGVDPLRTFRVVRWPADGWAAELTSHPADLRPRIIYLVPVAWSPRAVAAGSIGTVRDMPTFVAREFVRPPEADQGSGFDRRLPAWLLAGPSSLPHASAVTPSEVQALVRRLIPEPLRRAMVPELWDGDRGLCMRTVMRPVPERRWLPEGVVGQACPVTIIEIPVRAGEEVGELAPYTAWLAREIERRSVLGTFVEIVATREGEARG